MSTPTRTFYDSQARALFRLWDYFGYDASVFTTSDWEHFLDLIWARRLNGKDEPAATREAFVEFAEESEIDLRELEP